MFNYDPALMRAIQDDRYYRLRRTAASPESRPRRPRRALRRTPER